MIDISNQAGVGKVHAHMCPFDMKVLSEGEQQLVYKPTTWMSNSKRILQQLNRQCTNTGNRLTDHPHASLKHGGARFAQIYPENYAWLSSKASERN